MTRQEAKNLNKNLKLYMEINDKTEECKFLQDNHEALLVAIRSLEAWDNVVAEIKENEDVALQQGCNVTHIPGLIWTDTVLNIINKHLERVEHEKED